MDKKIQPRKLKFTAAQKKEIITLVSRLRMGIHPKDSFNNLDKLKVPYHVQNRIIHLSQNTNKYANTIIADLESGK